MPFPPVALAHCRRDVLTSNTRISQSADTVGKALHDTSWVLNTSPYVLTENIKFRPSITHGGNRDDSNVELDVFNKVSIAPTHTSWTMAPRHWPQQAAGGIGGWDRALSPRERPLVDRGMAGQYRIVGA
jgi:hypothetical protein